MLEPDTIGDAKLLADLLRNFSVELKRAPALPVSLHGLVDFLIAEGVSSDVVDAIVRQINGNVEMFRPVPTDRDRVTAHIWPDRTQEPHRFVSNETYWSSRTPIVTRRSKIVSLGSSFTAEIAKWLQLNGYNYLVTEANPIAGSEVHGSSARWARSQTPSVSARY